MEIPELLQYIKFLYCIVQNCAGMFYQPVLNIKLSSFDGADGSVHKSEEAGHATNVCGMQIYAFVLPYVQLQTKILLPTVNSDLRMEL